MRPQPLWEPAKAWITWLQVSWCKRTNIHRELMRIFIYEENKKQVWIFLVGVCWLRCCISAEIHAQPSCFPNFHATFRTQHSWPHLWLFFPAIHLQAAFQGPCHLWKRFKSDHSTATPGACQEHISLRLVTCLPVLRTSIFVSNHVKASYSSLGQSEFQVVSLPSWIQRN